MRKLIRGIIDFRKNKRPRCKDTFSKLALGQRPASPLTPPTFLSFAAVSFVGLPARGAKGDPRYGKEKIGFKFRRGCQSPLPRPNHAIQLRQNASLARSNIHDSL